ncbi:SMU1112c/YaeR family gloxylase I-like metalloprotein [Photobacterium andalusiense]|uniref:Metallothiol transferase FosB 2 n=1 Tax=Photobacterium andalusiense TaxID=2204296 RepID=A0A1Y6MFA4_9GAMM|nr:VOC family protein [Photobacterium andalusiense]SMY35255.1 Metallothiol transferase FosB 2 [Photobacterium andalusiense]
MLKAIHHVAIICSDYARSKAFYSQLLQLEIICETYREDRNSYKLDLKLPDNTQIELFSFNGAPLRLSYPEAQGLRHLAFAVDDLALTVDYLQQNGVEVEPIRIDDLTDKAFTFFSDPDGLPLELYQV